MVRRIVVTCRKVTKNLKACHNVHKELERQLLRCNLSQSYEKFESLSQLHHWNFPFEFRCNLSQSYEKFESLSQLYDDVCYSLASCNLSQSYEKFESLSQLYPSKF